MARRLESEVLAALPGPHLAHNTARALGPQTYISISHAVCWVRRKAPQRYRKTVMEVCINIELRIASCNIQSHVQAPLTSPRPLCVGTVAHRDVQALVP